MSSLGDWASAEAAPVLLEIARSDGRFQNRALRGYIGMAQKFNMSDEQRAQMCKNALEQAKQAAEQKAVLEVLKRHPSIETLKLAIQIMEKPELKKDATEAAQAISQKVPKSAEVQDLLSKAGLDK